MDFIAKGLSRLSSQYLEQESDDQRRKRYSEAINSTVEVYFSSSLREEKRMSVQRLQELSKRVYLSDEALKVLIDVVTKIEGVDVEMLVAALECLLNFFEICRGGEPQYPELRNSEEDEIAISRAEIFVREDFSKFLPLFKLREHVFVVYNVARLLDTLLSRKSFKEVVQEMMLSSPMSIPTVVDMLSFDQEILRNEGIVLLKGLCERSVEIQKIVAFQGTYKTIFSIATEDDGHEVGSIIAKDCIALLEILLKDNESNQNLFRETDFFNELARFVSMAARYPTAENPMPKSVLETYLHVFSIIAILCAPQGTGVDYLKNRKASLTSGLVKSLLDVVAGPLADFWLAEKALLLLTLMVDGSPELLKHIVSGVYPLAVKPGARLEVSIVSILLTLIVMGNEYFSFDRRDISANDKRIKSACLGLIEAVLMGDYESQYNLAVRVVAPESNDSVVKEVLLTIFSTKRVASTPPLIMLSTLRLFSILLFGNSDAKEKLALMEIAVPSDISHPVDVQNGGGDRGVTLFVALLRTMKEYAKLPMEKLNSRVLAEFLILVCTWVLECPAALRQMIISEDIDYIKSLVTREDATSVVQALAAYILGITVECISFGDFTFPDDSNEALSEKLSKRVSFLVNSVRNEIGIDNFTGLLAYISHSDEFTSVENERKKWKRGAELSEIDCFRLFLPSFADSFNLYHEKIRRRFLSFYLSPKPKEEGSSASTGVDSISESEEVESVLDRDLDNEKMKLDMKELEKNIHSLKTALKTANEAALHWKHTYEEEKASHVILQKELSKLKGDYNTLSKNHNDLLLLVAEMQEETGSSESDESMSEDEDISKPLVLEGELDVPTTV